jgi:hypothetical protein
MRDPSSTDARRGERPGRTGDSDRAEVRITPPESRINEKTDILPAINGWAEPQRDEYARRKHPVWVPAPTTVDHGPPNRPAGWPAIAARVVIVLLILLAFAGAMLFLVHSM